MVYHPQYTDYMHIYMHPYLHTMVYTLSTLESLWDNFLFHGWGSFPGTNPVYQSFFTVLHPCLGQDNCKWLLCKISGYLRVSIHLIPRGVSLDIHYQMSPNCQSHSCARTYTLGHSLFTSLSSLLTGNSETDFMAHCS